MNLSARIKSTYQTFPRQFWLMFLGMLISTLGASMIWPFLMIFVSSRLQMPLTAVASLLTLNSFMVLISSFLAGSVIDRFGRKWVMVISLAFNGINYIFLSHAVTFPQFAVLLAISGIVNPVFRIGTDAMMADLIPPPNRPRAYALLRLSNNAGIALGPAIGGFIASSSYNLAFYLAAIGMVTYSLLLLIFATETLPSRAHVIPSQSNTPHRLGGYSEIFRDKHFIGFATAFTLGTVCATLVWVLLPVYAKQNFNLPERIYGFIPTTNAFMVVTLQLFVTNLTKKYPPLPVVAFGFFFYAIGVGSIALGHSFWGFWVSMIILTIGELILVPTSSTYVANLAPPDKRGRYMSIYGLSWGVASGIGSIFGGVLNDQFGPRTIWYGGFIVGIIAMVSLLLIHRSQRRKIKIAQQLPI